MKVVGLTQRYYDNETYEERRDCLDQRWTTFLAKINIMPIPIPNLLIEESFFFDEIDIDGLIFTGGDDILDSENGNRKQTQRDKLELKLIEKAAEQSLPIIGVCRGFQVINDFFGGGLSKVENHVSIIHKLRFENKFKGILPEFVNSYHNNAISEPNLATPLNIMALSKDNYVEAASHNELPFLGIMWHPEREEEFKLEDLNLFSNHFGTNIQ